MAQKPEKIFKQIYDQYIDKIYRFIFLKVSSKETAQDLASEAFLRFWQTLDSPTQINNPRAFLYQIVRNLVIDHYREKGQAQFVPFENIVVKDLNPGIDLEKQAILTSDMQEIHQALTGLKQEYQDAIIFYYLDEFSVPEIAEIMNKSENAVRVTIHRALNSLRALINNDRG